MRKKSTFIIITLTIVVFWMVLITKLGIGQTKCNSSKDYLQIGLDLINKGEYSEAILLYDCALELDETRAEYYVYRAIAHENILQIEAALSDLNKGIDLNPTPEILIGAFVARANIHRQNQNYTMAIEDLTSALTLSDDADIVFQRGILYFENGDYTEAVKDFTRGSQQSPNEVSTLFYRGFAHKKLGNYNQAINDLSQYIESNPGFAETYLLRGDAFYDLGNLMLALDDYYTYIELLNQNNNEPENYILERITEIEDSK